MATVEDKAMGDKYVRSYEQYECQGFRVLAEPNENDSDNGVTQREMTWQDLKRSVCVTAAVFALGMAGGEISKTGQLRRNGPVLEKIVQPAEAQELKELETSPYKTNSVAVYEKK